MAEQMQCPNCGGYRTHGWQIDLRTGKPPSHGMGTVYTLFACAAFWVVLPMLQRALVDSTYALLIVISAAVLSAAGAAYKWSTIPRELGYRHNCALCGYEWAPGERRRKRTRVRKELMEKGAARLDEESKWDE